VTEIAAVLHMISQRPIRKAEVGIDRFLTRLCILHNAQPDAFYTWLDAPYVRGETNGIGGGEARNGGCVRTSVLRGWAQLRLRLTQQRKTCTRSNRRAPALSSVPFPFLRPPSTVHLPSTRHFPTPTMRLPGLLLPAGLSLVRLAAAAYDMTACNSSPQLCDIPYDQILHVGAHNAAFVRTASNRFALSGNQYHNATVQLSAGVRLLQSQVHLEENEVRLCHSSCDIFDGGTLADWLAAVRTWMLKHEREVVTLLLVNSDNIPATRIAEVFAAAGLAEWSFVPDGSGWPTLQSLILDRKRLVTFISTSADVAAVPYLLPEFQFIFETDFEVSDPTNYTCYATRPVPFYGPQRLPDVLATGRIGLMNRFLYRKLSETLNIFAANDTYATTLNGDTGVGNLKDGVAACTREWGKRGGFVLLDFVDQVCSFPSSSSGKLANYPCAHQGNPIAVVDAHNNVTNPVNRDPFPPNPKTVSDEQRLNDVGGAESIRRLVDRVKKGESVVASQWIFAAGKWVGTWKMNGA